MGRDDNDSDDESVARGEVAFPTTPSSEVEAHVSLRDDAGSPDTVILEEDEEPLVNEQSLLRVMSSSHSFLGPDQHADLGTCPNIFEVTKRRMRRGSFSRHLFWVENKFRDTFRVSQTFPAHCSGHAGHVPGERLGGVGR